MSWGVTQEGSRQPPNKFPLVMSPHFMIFGGLVYVQQHTHPVHRGKGWWGGRGPEGYVSRGKGEGPGQLTIVSI